MKFEVQTHYYNQEQLAQLITAQGRFGKRGIYYIMGAILLGLCLLILWPQLQSGDVTSALLTLGGLVVLFGYYLFRLGRCKPTDRSTQRTARKAVKKMQGKREAVTFTFRDDFFVVIGDRGAEQVHYEELIRAAESDYCFILQIKRGFFIVPKEDFVIGNSGDFFTFLKQKTSVQTLRLNY